jgi:hypothetical protein
MTEFHNSTLLGTRCRAAVVTAMFDKELRVAPWAQDYAGTGGGQISINDAQKLYDASVFCTLLWSSPLAIMVACVLLYAELGVSVRRKLFLVTFFCTGGRKKKNTPPLVPLP